MFRNIYFQFMSWLFLVTTQNVYQPLNSNFFSSAIPTCQNPRSVSRVEKYFCSAEAISCFTYLRSVSLVVNNFDLEVELLPKIYESCNYGDVLMLNAFKNSPESTYLEDATLSPSRTSLLFSQNFVNQWTKKHLVGMPLELVIIEI